MDTFICFNSTQVLIPSCGCSDHLKGIVQIYGHQQFHEFILDLNAGNDLSENWYKFSAANISGLTVLSHRPMVHLFEISVIQICSYNTPSEFCISIYNIHVMHVFIEPAL